MGVSGLRRCVCPWVLFVQQHKRSERKGPLSTTLVFEDPVLPQNVPETDRFTGLVCQLQGLRVSPTPWEVSGSRGDSRVGPVLLGGGSGLESDGVEGRTAQKRARSGGGPTKSGVM